MAHSHQSAETNGDLMTKIELRRTSQRRFLDHTKHGRPIVLSEDHPAIIESRPLFKRSANQDRWAGRVLISGHNQRKLGKRITKGVWKGFEIYTLTLEERKTCPRTCQEWLTCYGNHMPRSIRQPAGGALEAMIEAELAELQDRHPRGFVIRLHILGDFYSVEYVAKWGRWLGLFPALHVFGYTARQDAIGAAIADLVSRHWGRFAIRSSGGVLSGVPAAIVIAQPAEAQGDAIICPVQTGRTDCCATCGLCWTSKRPIAFLRH